MRTSFSEYARSSAPTSLATSVSSLAVTRDRAFDAVAHGGDVAADGFFNGEL